MHLQAGTIYQWYSSPINPWCIRRSDRVLGRCNMLQCRPATHFRLLRSIPRWSWNTFVSFYSTFNQPDSRSVSFNNDLYPYRDNESSVNFKTETSERSRYPARASSSSLYDSSEIESGMYENVSRTFARADQYGITSPQSEYGRPFATLRHFRHKLKELCPELQFINLDKKMIVIVCTISMKLQDKPSRAISNSWMTSLLKSNNTNEHRLSSFHLSEIWYICYTCARHQQAKNYH